ncbi:MAG: FAD-dependent monooxygenase [Pseudonocardiaceae bacterium]
MRCHSYLQSRLSVWTFRHDRCATWVVVGAGPTGLRLASELALAGVAVEVIERQVVPSGQSRGGGINSRTAEVLAQRTFRVALRPGCSTATTSNGTR